MSYLTKDEAVKLMEDQGFVIKEEEHHYVDPPYTTIEVRLNKEECAKTQFVMDNAPDQYKCLSEEFVFILFQWCDDPIKPSVKNAFGGYRIKTTADFGIKLKTSVLPVNYDKFIGRKNQFVDKETLEKMLTDIWSDIHEIRKNFKKLLIQNIGNEN